MEPAPIADMHKLVVVLVNASGIGGYARDRDEFLHGQPS
jgi:hypothetical protein